MCQATCCLDGKEFIAESFEAAISSLNSTLNSKQDASTAITTSNIGSQSVNYATSAGSATNATNAGYANTAGWAQPVFNNYTWYNVGDDIQMGDRNIGGALCLRGMSGDSTNVYLITQDSSYGGWVKLTSDGSMHLISNNARLQAGNNGTVYLQVTNKASVVNLANSTWMPIYASAFTLNSSKVVKENIVDMPKDEAMKILDLRVVEFDYINGAKNQCGLIAEEVKDIIPYCVDIPDNYNEETAKMQVANGELPVVPGIDYSKLVAPLIKLVQMQQEQIELLTQKVDELINI